MTRLDLERQHSVAQCIACDHSEWLAWIWKDNILLHNTLRVVMVNDSPGSGKTTFCCITLRVVIVNGSPGFGKTTFYYTIHCVWSKWMARLDLERQHSIAQCIVCGHSGWLAWIWKDNILLHNAMHVVIVAGSPGSGKTTFYCTMPCMWS